MQEQKKSSFSFANVGRNSFNKNKPTPANGEEKKDGESKENAAAVAKKNRAKKNPLLLTITDDYVDDSELFKGRISRNDKVEYWHKLSEIKLRRKPPRFFNSWIKKETAVDDRLLEFPANYRFLMYLCISNRWDHFCLDLFVLYIVLLTVFVDGWIEQYAPILVSINTGNLLLTVVLVLMLMTQIIPLLGTIYFVCRANDLVQYAASQNFPSWAFVAALTAQYIEYFYYSGVGRSDRARCVRLSREQIEINKERIAESSSCCVCLTACCCHRNAKIGALDAIDEENFETESHDSSIASNESGQQQQRQQQLRSIGMSLDTNITEDTYVDSVAHAESKDVENQLQSPPPAAAQAQSQIDNTKHRNDVGNNFNISSSAKEGASTKNRPGSGSKKRRRKDGSDRIEFLDWRCILCGTNNHRPRHPVIESDVVFGETGKYYRRTYAVVIPRRDMPTCVKCFTYADYQPPLGSAHLFPLHPNPHEAFQNYPRKPALQLGLKTDKTSMWLNRIYSFFAGIQNSIDSAAVANDWRLRKFISNQMPEIPRYKLAEHEFYIVGEVVESRQQKSDWQRAKVLRVHSNHTYDIKYDPGDELRFVLETSMRSRPEKRNYAYRTELGAVAIVVWAPVGVLLAMSGSPSLLLLGPLLVSLVLLAMRVGSIVQYTINYAAAGFCSILLLSSLYTLPLFFLMLACVIGVANTGVDPTTWATVAVLLIITKILSLPVLYMMRPPYALLAIVIYVQTSIATHLLGQYASGALAPHYIGIALAPVLTATLTLKYARYHLHNIWDVCLAIRPRRDTSAEDPHLWTTVARKSVEFWSWIT